MEERKLAEREFHDRIRSVMDDEHVADTRWSPEMEQTIKNNPLWANMKYYSIERKSRSIVLKWFNENCRDKRVLDYCCGNGDDGIFIAQHGAGEVVGVDISETSLNNCREKIRKIGLTNIRYESMDAEHLAFNDGVFDIVTEYGAMHHLNLDRAYAEMARVLKSDGKAICVEALGHNKIIHYYRKLTPDLRTTWEVEHILRKNDIELANKYFKEVKILGFYHLTTLLAVPFRSSRVFDLLLRVLETMDRLLLKIPVIKWQAWQIIFVMSKPRK